MSYSQPPIQGLVSSKRNRRVFLEHELCEKQPEPFKLFKNKKDNIVKLDGFSLREIQPKTDAQSDVFDAFREGYNLLLHGSAGTGKTFIAYYLALAEIEKQSAKYKSVTIVRSAVPTRDIGFLPGELSKKLEVYEAPYRAITTELYERGDAFDILKTKGLVNFISTSYIRGLTLKNTIVIIDEVQNMSDMEINTIITRMGKNSRVIFCGDSNQDDLSLRKNEISGLNILTSILEQMESFDIIEFTHADIVRSKMVRDYIIARDQYFSQPTT